MNVILHNCTQWYDPDCLADRSAWKIHAGSLNHSLAVMIESLVNKRIPPNVLAGMDLTMQCTQKGRQDNIRMEKCAQIPTKIVCKAEILKKGHGIEANCRRHPDKATQTLDRNQGKLQLRATRLIHRTI